MKTRKTSNWNGHNLHRSIRSDLLLKSLKHFFMHKKM